MRYEFHPEALNEFEEAALYYSRRLWRGPQGRGYRRERGALRGQV